MDKFSFAARALNCIAAPDEAALPIHAVRPSGLAAFLDTCGSPAKAYLLATGFAAAAGAVALLPGPDGLAGAVLGLGEGNDQLTFGALPGALPPSTAWRLHGELDDPDMAALAFMLGAYRFDQFRASSRPAPCRLILPPGAAHAETIAHATWLARDLINLPANVLGPSELAAAASAELTELGATVDIIAGEALDAAYPLIAAVGAGSARPPRVVVARWQHAQAGPGSKLVSLCGKGVCFDTGGYDLKPSASMLRMKKDMAGAAIASAIAKVIIKQRLPVRLELRLGCVENSVSGNAMRPLDILRSRRGLTVAVGNTDAEGRLVLADLLAEASDASPDLLLDFATLTGAARVALGPDVIALFSNDDALASEIASAARGAHDPVWRLPLWSGYNSFLDTHAADLNNVSEKPYAGSIIAALFLERFVKPGIRWAHFDLYGWNDSTRPARPEGGEAQGLRAALNAISRIVNVADETAAL
jgi:leucyl aminopeptidase